jgi:predicted extracellular nuclease
MRIALIGAVARPGIAWSTILPTIRKSSTRRHRLCVRTGALAICALLVIVGSGQVQATGTYEDAPGSFFPAVRYAVGANPFSVAEGDFNGDGRIDLAVGNWDGNTVSILLGTGAGAFAAAVDYGVGSGAQTVAVADFNGDQKPDLAVANIWSHDVSVLLGTGTGTFAASVQYPCGTNPRSVAIGDFNDDGKPDLVVPNGSSGNISVLLGVGNGTFGAATNFSVGINPISVAIGKFNADAATDLAVANQGSNSVSFLPGTGTGTFGAATDMPVGTGPTSVATADFNADGRPDLAVTNVDGGNVSLLFGTGSGTFTAASPVTAGIRPTYVAAGDLNGDGNPELAVANEGWGTISILLGSASGVFGSAIDLQTTGQGARAVAIGDLDNDGLPDLAAVNPQDNVASVLLGEILPVLDVRPISNVDATSSYALRKSTLWINRQVPPGWPFAHAAYADFNKDGRIDFVRTFSDNTVRRPVQFMRNDGGGSFTDQTATVVSNAQPGVITTRKILIGDYNADSWPDAFIINHGLDIPSAPGEFPQVFLSNGNGTLRYVPDLEPFVAFNHGGASADIDGNGTLDVLLISPTQPYILLNDGLGRFTRNWNRLPAEIAGNIYNTGELIDVDQDGFVDILIGGGELQSSGEPTAATTAIYWGNRTGYYRASNKTILPSVATWGIVLDYAAEDIDGDGRRDLVLNRTGSQDVYVGRYFQILRQTAPRVFVDETGARISMDTTQEWVDYIRVQDLDGDDDLDIFLDDKDFVTKGAYAWINNGAGVFAPYTGLVTALAPAPALSITDVAVSEGNSGTKVLTFTVGLSSISSTAVTFDIATANGTAVAGSDYVARSLAGQSIAAGQLSKTFAVTLTGDAAIELDETVVVNLANAAGATITDGQAIGTIVNDDGPALSVADVSVAEGASGTRLLTFTVKLSAASTGAVGYNVSVGNGTAFAGTDYVAVASTPQSIPAGQTSRTFAITINGDTAIEANETLLLKLDNPVGGVIADGQATGTLLNDDGATLSIADATISEGNSGTKAIVFTVALSQPAATAVSFNIATANYSAVAGSDFVARSLAGQSIPAGQTSRIVSVSILGDTVLEPNEALIAIIGGVTGPVTVLDDRAIGTILNDDGPTLSIADVAINEGNSGTTLANFVVKLSQAAAAPVTFNIATANATATGGSDFVARSLVAQSIPAGQTSYAFAVTINGDATIEPNETFQVNVSNVGSGATVADGQATGTIINDEGPRLSIANASVIEGNADKKLLIFTLSLSQAAASPVTYSISTVNGSAVGGSDYITSSTTATIATGATSKIYSVWVYGDTAVEADETFFALITSLSGGASLYDDRAIGTITNDDAAPAPVPVPSALPIATIQGNGPMSPFAGQWVETRGIVTALTAHGFFAQTPEGDQDDDRLTSEGLFVASTSRVLAVGDDVRIRGRVREVQVGPDPAQLTLTRIDSTDVTLLGRGKTLPAPIRLDADNAGPGQAIAALERFEGMRVVVPQLQVVAPSGGTLDAVTGQARGDGRFYGVAQGVPRPFREPGLSALEPVAAPAGAAPRTFDTNPERLQVDTAGQRGAVMRSVDAGDRIAGLRGVLGYGEGAYRVLPDPTLAWSVTSGATPRPASTPGATQATIGSIDLQRFFDDRRAANEPVLDPAAYATRLARTANAICAYARSPAILAVSEVEDVATLADLAAAVNGKDGNLLFPAQCRDDTAYRAMGLPGTAGGDGGLGFLLDATPVRPGVPRVERVSLAQAGATVTFQHRDGTREPLHARPPLVLQARINDARGHRLPITVIATHFSALDGDLAARGPHGWDTRGDYLRARRAAQAVDLAGFIQARQRTRPDEKLVVLGDFDASEFDDGHDDLLGVVAGRPAARGQVLDFQASPVAPPLTNLTLSLPATERYTVTRDGNALALSHVLVNAVLLAADPSLHLEVVRINADFGLDNSGDATVPVRVGERDPLVLYLRVE